MHRSTIASNILLILYDGRTRVASKCSIFHRSMKVGKLKKKVMLELHGDFGIKMRSLSFSLLAAIVVFSSCRKQVEEPKDRTVYVISRTSGQPLSNVEMHLNGQFHSYTPLDGIAQETDLLRTDSL